VNTNAIASPAASEPARWSSHPLSHKLELALEKAKGAGDFTQLRILMDDESFSRDAIPSGAEKAKIDRALDQILNLSKSTKPTFDSVTCQALYAKYYACPETYSKASTNYHQAIESYRKHNLYKVTGYEPFEQSCRIGLALIYLHQNKIAEAEKLYEQLLGSNNSLTGEARKNRLMMDTYPMSTKTGEAVIAVKLAASYEAAGQYDKALAKYTDMLVFEGPALEAASKKTLPSSYPIIVVHHSETYPQSTQRPDFDPLVGSYPSTKQIVEPYIQFAKRHPQIVRKESLGPVEEQLQKVVNLVLPEVRFPARPSHVVKIDNLGRVQEQVQTIQSEQSITTSSDQDLKWQMREQGYLMHLHDEPEKVLGYLERDLNTRKKADPNNPALASSINLIGYQLMLAGLYADAERFMKEAIALREKQGSIGRYGLGNSLSNLGVLYLEEGKLLQARPLFEKALLLREGDPSDPYAQAKTEIEVGRLLAAGGKPLEAEKQMTKAIEALRGTYPVPGQISAKEISTMVRPGVDPTEKIVAKLRTPAAGGWFYPLALVELGSLYIDERKYDLARATLVQAQASAPPVSDLALDARVAEKLGRLETIEGNLPRAESLLTKAELSVTSNKATGMTAVDILSAVGDLKSKQRKGHEARDYYSKAAVRLAKMVAPQDPRVVRLRKLASSA
jgi:tetratricopeptide (TPR) repeat protein